MHFVSTGILVIVACHNKHWISNNIRKLTYGGNAYTYMVTLTE